QQAGDGTNRNSKACCFTHGFSVATMGVGVGPAARRSVEGPPRCRQASASWFARDEFSFPGLALRALDTSEGCPPAPNHRLLAGTGIEFEGGGVDTKPGPATIAARKRQRPAGRVRDHHGYSKPVANREIRSRDG